MKINSLKKMHLTSWNATHRQTTVPMLKNPLNPLVVLRVVSLWNRTHTSLLSAVHHGSSGNNIAYVIHHRFCWVDITHVCIQHILYILLAIWLLESEDYYLCMCSLIQYSSQVIIWFFGPDNIWIIDHTHAYMLFEQGNIYVVVESLLFR